MLQAKHHTTRPIYEQIKLLLWVGSFFSESTTYCAWFFWTNDIYGTDILINEAKSRVIWFESVQWIFHWNESSRAVAESHVISDAHAENQTLSSWNAKSVTKHWLIVYLY